MIEIMNIGRLGTRNIRKVGDFMAKNRIKKEFFESTEMLLRNFRGIKKHIDILENTMTDIQEYKTRGIKAVATDGIRVSSNPGDSIGKQVVKIAEMEDKVLKEIEDEKKYLYLIKKGLSSLSQEDREIISMRYFDNIPDSKIAQFTSYERSWVQRKRTAAVRKIAICIYGIKCLEA